MTVAVAPGLSNILPGSLSMPGVQRKTAASTIEKARANAQDFEAVFLNSMFQHMFSSVGKGPFSGGPGASTWRSFLTDEYAKSFAKKGGIGIADQVQRELLTKQEIAMSGKTQ